MKYNPFNPQQPARPDFFVGRMPEIEEFERFLSQTMHGSPMNLSITGNRGMGKTSLLVKFEEIARNNGCLVLRLSNYEGNIHDIVEFSDYLASNIKREILARKSLQHGAMKALEWAKSLKAAIHWNEIGITIEQKQIAQELLRERLLKMWAEVKKECPAIVILFDEAESLEKIEGSLAFIREVFQRLSTDANYMVVLAGKLNFPERMSESFSPLNRFFPCQKLSPLKYDDVESYAVKKLGMEGVKIDKNALDYLFKKSEGHPYVLVIMCYLIFDSLNDAENKINLELINRSKEKVNAKLVDDFFSPMYHPLTPRAKEHLRQIASHAKGKEFSFSEAVEWTETESSYLSPYIQELLRKGILNKPGRGKYEIFHELFLEYLKKMRAISDSHGQR